MDIRCERCQAEYEFDESRLPEGGLTVRCAACGHVFKVLRARPPATGPLELRRAGVPLAVAPDLATVAQWIAERRLLPSDEVSSGGSLLRRLVDLPELARAFPPPPVAAAPAAPALGEPFHPAGLHLPTGAEIPSTPVEASTTVQLYAGAAAHQQHPAREPDGAITSPRWAIPVATRAPAETPPGVSTPASHPASARPAPYEQPTEVMVAPQLLPPEEESFAGRFGPPAGGGHEHEGLAEPEAPTLTSAPALRLPTPLAPGPTEAFVPPVRAAAAPVQPERSGTPAELPAVVRSQNPAVPAPALEMPARQPSSAARRTSGSDSGPQPSSATFRASKSQVGQWRSPSVVDGDDEDQEILAFQTHTKRRRVLAAVVVVLVVLGAGGYFAYRPVLELLRRPPAAAVQAYESGRTGYLTDTIARFPDAEASFKQAVGLAKDAGKPYPAAHAALAQLECAWAEQLRVEAARDSAQAQWDGAQAERAKAQAAAGGTPAPGGGAVDARVASATAAGRAAGRQAADLMSDVQARLKTAGAEAKLAASEEPDSSLAGRAMLDYAHLAGDAKLEQQVLAGVQEAAQTDPESKALYWEVESANLQKQQEAERALGDTVKSDKPFIRAAWWLGLLKEKVGDDDGAQAEMKAILAVAPDHEGAKGWLKARAQAAAEQKAAEAAASAAEAQKAAANSHDAELIKEANKLLAGSSLRGYHKALSLCEEVLEAQPANIDALYDKGVALFNLSQVNAAIAMFKKALAVNPHFSDGMSVLAEAYRMEGNKKEALRWYREYLKAAPNGQDAAEIRKHIKELSR